MRRRDFLVAAAVAAGGATAGGVAHWLRRPEESEAPEPSLAPDAEAEPGERVERRASLDPTGLFDRVGEK